MAHQPSSSLDHPGLKTGQRPVLHRLRQHQPSQEVTQVISQYEQLQPDLIGHELVAGQPRPVQGVLAFFYPLLRGASAIVKADYPDVWIAQIGDDEAHSGKQFSLVPLHLRDHLDRIHITFDDHRLVNNAGLLLPATLALHLGLSQLVDRRLDLGRAPGRANTGDKMMTLVASALAGGDCIDDADALRAGGTACTLGSVVKAPSTLGTFLRSFR